MSKLKRIYLLILETSVFHFWHSITVLRNKTRKYFSLPYVSIQYSHLQKKKKFYAVNEKLKHYLCK